MRKRIEAGLARYVPVTDPMARTLADVEGPVPANVVERLERCRPAAVLLGLVERNDGLAVVLTQRARHLSAHAGQVSLPGGRIEPQDRDLVATALREANEEIGLPARWVDTVGQLDSFMTLTGFHITPIVGFIDPAFVARPDAAEVEAVFEVPLAFLLDERNVAVGTRERMGVDVSSLRVSLREPPDLGCDSVDSGESETGYRYIKQLDMENIQKLLDIMAQLRNPASGCPWDLEQSFASIAPFTIEEAYEVADAIERDDMAHLKEELGDLLFQVVFHARLAEEAREFAFADVVEAIAEKLIRRHPHVFGGAKIATSEEQAAHWETLKAREKGAAAGVLSDVPVSLPALTRSAKLGRRASRVGYDWPDISGARAKLAEEIAELDEAIAGGQRAEIEAEMGDVFFALVNVCRHLELDPEAATRGANAKFERRFGGIERAVGASGRSWETFSLQELEAFWRDAKAAEGA